MSDLVGNPEDRFSQNEAHLENGPEHKYNFLILKIPLPISKDQMLNIICTMDDVRGYF